jgi:hypothetical protein
MRAKIDGESLGSWRESLPSLRGDYSGGIFSAYFPLQLPIDETRGHEHWLWIYVRREADTLRGYAVAHAADGPHYGLPYAIMTVRNRPRVVD